MEVPAVPDKVILKGTHVRVRQGIPGNTAAPERYF